MFFTLLHLSPVELLPQNLQSLLPLEPIEDPNNWAWANHPRQGFSYKSKDSLSVEVCLQNPKLIATAKCQLPLDVCLSNPQFIAQVGCSGSEIKHQLIFVFINIVFRKFLRSWYMLKISRALKNSLLFGSALIVELKIQSDFCFQATPTLLTSAFSTRIHWPHPHVITSSQWTPVFKILSSWTHQNVR